MGILLAFLGAIIIAFLIPGFLWNPSKDRMYQKGSVHGGSE